MDNTLMDRLQQASLALEAAERRNPLADEIDQLVDDEAAARIAVRRSRIDQAWVVAQSDLDTLARRALVPRQTGPAGDETAMWSTVRLATGVVMEQYGLDKNRASALIARAAERNAISAHALAQHVVRAAGLD